MNTTMATRFTFDPEVSMQEVEGTLCLARLAAESIHGFGRVMLDASCSLDRKQRCVRIDVSTDVGHTLALVFLGYVRREFGEGSVEIVPASHRSELHATVAA
jgi:hypothetical protein